MRSRWLTWVGAALIAMTAAIVAADGVTPPSDAGNDHRPAQTAGTPPTVSVIPIPPFPGAYALWGSTGQDARGHIWFGVSAERVPGLSAHLFEYIPGTGQLIDRGNVVDELKRAGIWRPGEQQAKIHSRIVAGPDGCLYFSSMDEAGEHDDGSQLPRWGGHLWRLRLATNRWEHLFAAPEALIAVAGGDRFIYALGYFGHILYRYDTKTGTSARIEVGSVDGHISRNIIADDRGHVYVPRLRADTPPGGRRVVHVGLVEFDSNLREIAETPIDAAHYLVDGKTTESQGIVAFQEMADRSIFFTTHAGFLYQITPPVRAAGHPPSETAALVHGIAWFHPAGPMLATSLFTSAKGDRLYGVARRSATVFEWLACDGAMVNCAVAPLQVPVDPGVDNILLYGSSTRDAGGAHYVVGTTFTGDTNRPLVLRVTTSAGG